MIDSEIRLLTDYDSAMLSGCLRKTLGRLGKDQSFRIIPENHHLIHHAISTNFSAIPRGEKLVIDISLTSALGSTSIGDTFRDTLSLEKNALKLVDGFKALSLQFNEVIICLFEEQEYLSQSTNIKALGWQSILPSTFLNHFLLENLRLPNITYLKPNRVFSIKNLFHIDTAYSVRDASHLAEQICFSFLPSTLHRYKVICVDFDNTLWGGVLGENGSSGVLLGGLTPKGKAFKAIQLHLKLLRDRGFLLAATSKNDLSVIQDHFINHPEMVLELGDFSALEVGWGRKSKSIELISKKLNLSTSSFLFIDDSDQEIEEVKNKFPEIGLIRFSGDPFKLLTLILSDSGLRTSELTDEDQHRHLMYKQNNARQDYLSRSENQNDLSIASVLEVSISRMDVLQSKTRALQLLNKTNQFNAITRRFSEGEFSNILTQNDINFLAYRAGDKFGDYGLISVISYEYNGGILKIVDFVISCRAICKGVEEAIVMDLCRLTDCSQVCISFIDSGRNTVFSKFLEKYSLSKLPSKQNDSSLLLCQLEENAAKINAGDF